MSQNCLLLKKKSAWCKPNNPPLFLQNKATTQSKWSKLLPWKQLVSIHHMSLNAHHVAAPSLPTHHPLHLSKRNLPKLLMANMLKKQQKRKKKSNNLYIYEPITPHINYLLSLTTNYAWHHQLRCGQSMSLEAAAGPMTLLHLPP